MNNGNLGGESRAELRMGERKTQGERGGVKMEVDVNLRGFNQI